MDTVRACVERHAADTPDRTFLIAPESGKTLSFGELEAAVEAVRDLHLECESGIGHDF